MDHDAFKSIFEHIGRRVKARPLFIQADTQYVCGNDQLVLLPFFKNTRVHKDPKGEEKSSKRLDKPMIPTADGVKSKSKTPFDQALIMHDERKANSDVDTYMHSS
jgi:hypothetical protein